MDVEILKNQLVIMEGTKQLLWDSMSGTYNADKEYIDELNNRIEFTKARIRGII